MKSLFRNLLLGTWFLVLCSPVFPASTFSASNNPYNLKLERLCSALSSADQIHKLVLLDQIFHLRDYVDDPADISSVFSEIAREPDDGLVRSEAQSYLQDIAVLEGSVLSKNLQHWYEQEQQRNAVIAQARSQASGAPGLEVLADLEHLAGVPGAAEHMQQAAQQSPTAERWEHAAMLSDDSLTKFADLQAGLALDRTNVAIRLQLATYYVGRQQLEKAHSLLQEALRLAPQDYLIGERVVTLYLNLGLRSTSLETLRRLEGRSPLPIWLQARLAIDYEQLGLLDDAARFAASVIQKKHTDREQLQLLARIHERRHMTAELAADYAALLRVQPDSASLWSRLAQLQIDSAELGKARDAMLRVIALDPHNAEAHRQLAEIYTRLHQQASAEQELAAASELLRKPGAPADPNAGLLADAGSLAAESFRHPPREEDVALADIRVQKLDSAGLSRMHVQQIFYAGSEAAVIAHRSVGLRFSPGSEALEIVHARVWKPNGSVIEAQEEGEYAVGDTTVSMYYDMRSRQLRFAGMEKGDVVELEYSLAPTLKTSPYPGYFGQLITLAGRAPARLERYALISPVGQHIFVHAEKLPAPTTRERDGIRTQVWEIHNVPGLSREPRSPGITETSPYLHISTMANWQQLGAWYADLIRPQFALDQSLQKELARLIEDKRSDAEKISAIQEFVLRSTHYVALEFGIYNYKPYPVSQTYARRFGDCKDKASLMIALLRTAGIEAEIALVRTRSLGDVAPTPASIALFDHAIVYVPKYSLWLDGTAEYAGNELPAEDQGALALTVSLDGAAQLRQVPMSTAADNYTKRTIRAELTRQGLIHFKGSTLTHGEGVPDLRRELAVPEQQLDLFRQRLAEVFPGVRLESVAVHGMQDLASDVSVDFEGALNALQHRSTVTLGSSWMRRAYVSMLAPTNTRTEDLVLGAPWTAEEEIHVTLPPGATVQQLPPDQEIKTDFGSARLLYSKSSHEIVIRSRLEIATTRINVQAYPAFHQFCSTVERSFRNQIVVGLTE